MFPDHNLLAHIERFCVVNETGLIEGIKEYCEKNNIEVELIAHLIKKDPLFKAKIQLEAERLNVIKRTTAAVLPI